MTRPRPRLVVMVKEPQPGRVKTRLARDIGAIPAAWWFRHNCRRLLARLDGPAWVTELAVSPDRAGLASRAWPPHLPRCAQGEGDLGARMARLFRRRAIGPMVIIGADIPEIRRPHIAQAFHQLQSRDAVIGPAADGGYWLIGLARRRRPPAHLFRGVRWSTKWALADTLATLPDRRVGWLTTLHDVDTLADLRAVQAMSPKLTHRP